MSGALTKLPIRIIFLLVWVAILAVGGIVQGKLSSVQENDSASFLPADAESARAGAKVQGFLASEDVPILITGASQTELTKKQIGQFQKVARQILDVKVIDPRDGSETSIAELSGAVTAAAIPPADLKAILIPLSVPKDVVDARSDEGRGIGVIVTAMRDAIEDLDLPVEMTLHVAGPGGYIADLVGAFGGVDLLLLLVALGVVLVILLIVYRSLVLPIAVLSTDLFALCGAALVVYQLAARDILTLNGQSQGIMSILVIGATTDYALLLVARYRESLTEFETPHEAMQAALKGAGPAIIASAATVVVGLLALLLSGLSATRSLGPIAAIGIGAASALAPTFKAAGTTDSAILRNGGDAVTGNAILDRHFPAGSVQPIEVVASKDAAQSLTAKLGEITDVERVTAYLDDNAGTPAGKPSAGEAPEGEGPPTGVEGPPNAAKAEPKVVDGQVLLNVATRHPPDDLRSGDVVNDVRTIAHEADSDALVVGAAAEKLDTRDTARADIWRVVPVTLAGIFVMLIILLRSLAAPLILIGANCLSFLATMGLSALVFNHILDLPGADPSVPLYGFVFLVALGIDYTIFLMARVREESASMDTRRALRKALATTGGVITSAGLVLAATFAALAIIPLLFMLQLAVIVALGVLIDTFIVRALLVAGITHDVGEPMWWPARRRRDLRDTKAVAAD